MMDKTPDFFFMSCRQQIGFQPTEPHGISIQLMELDQRLLDCKWASDFKESLHDSKIATIQLCNYYKNIAIDKEHPHLAW